MKKQDATKTYVYQSNDLVNAFYHCSIAEKRLLNLAVSKINVESDNWLDLTVQVNIDEYANYYSHAKTTRNIRKEVLAAAERLHDRKIKFCERGENIYRSIVWERAESLVEKGGYIKLSFPPVVARELVKLFHNGNFTTYTIEDTKDLTSFQAYRLYEIAMQFLDKKTGKGEVWNIPVEKMRAIMLGEASEKYPNIGAFYSHVVKRAADHITDKTNMTIKAERVKKDGSLARQGAPIQGFRLDFEIKNPAILINKKPQEKPAPEVENRYEPADHADYIDGEIVQPKTEKQEETAMSRSEKIAAQVAARQAEIEARGGLKVPPKESNADFLGGIERSLREAAALAAANGSVDDLERALKMLKALEGAAPEPAQDASDIDENDMIDPAEYARIWNERNKEAEEKRKKAQDSLAKMRQNLKF